MTTSLARRLLTRVTHPRALQLIAVFLAVLGSRLWLIQNYGSDVPVGDQWDAEASLLYKPLLEHGYGAVHWFAAHNEHRIVLTRLTATVMLLVNGQWDPLLQQVWEAVCSALIAVLICMSAIRLMPRERSIGLVFGVVLVGLSMPFGWENTLAGFQNQFCYLMLLTVAMLYLCAYPGLLTTRRSVLVATLGLLSLGTLASGAFACVAAACALAARLAFLRQADKRRVIGLMVVLAALALFGFGTTPTVPAHHVLHVQNLAQFLRVFNIVLGWPTTLGWIVWLPFAAWCVQSLVRRRVDVAGLFVVGLGAFVLLNAAATAIARGSTIVDVTYLASRYTDVAWFGWLVNLLAALLLVRGRNESRSTVGGQAFVMSIFLVAVIALGNAGWSGAAGAAQRGAFYALESSNTRLYVASGDPASLRDQSPGHIPYPNAEQLMKWLDDPTIRPLLPAGIRQGVLARSGATPQELTSHGLVPTAVPPGTAMAPPPFIGAFSSTWSGGEHAHTAQFVSAPIQAEGATLRTYVLGNLGRPGLSLQVEDIASGKRVDLVADRGAAGVWTSVRATVPGSPYRVVAEDVATDEGGWFAFTDPVEIGRLRRLTEFLIRIGRETTLVGLALFLASVLVRCPRRATANRPRRPALPPGDVVGTGGASIAIPSRP